MTGSPFSVMSAHSVIHARMVQPSLVDYPGRMSALLFTSGCNFRCGFCHNTSLLPGGGTCYSWQELEGFAAVYRAAWAEAVTITGGEPTLHPALPETIAFWKRQGFLVKLDTNGSKPELLRQIIADVDYVAMDMKCAYADYPRLTGWTDTEAIQTSVELIKAQATDYEFRVTLLENFHDDAQIEACARQVGGARRLIFQPFLPREDLPDPALRGLPRTRPSRLQEAVRLAAPWVDQALCR